MLRGFSLQALSAGILAALVGFASATVVIPGLLAVGATPAEAASGLMALSVAMGVAGIVLSALRRMPISIAWSTPGAALLATTGAVEGGFPAAVGAFVVTGLLIVAAGLWKPLGRWVAALPAPLANAMLAGVLLDLCLAPVRAVAELPVLALVVIGAWLAVGRVNRLYALPAAVATAVVLIAATTEIDGSVLLPVTPAPLVVVPSFSFGAIVGLALPLFVVTMASQNITGMAVLQSNGYRPAPGPLFTVTGVFGLLAAPFGGHAVNLAAITAAMCAGEDAHPDPARRWWAAVVAGACYIVLGLCAGAATAFMEASPPVLILAVAGLALLGAFGASAAAALQEVRDREAAVVTFVVTASGVAFFGISGAFWGLMAGGAVMALARWKRG